jgi:hypothetical protein
MSVSTNTTSQDTAIENATAALISIDQLKRKPNRAPLADAASTLSGARP